MSEILRRGADDHLIDFHLGPVARCAVSHLSLSDTQAIIPPKAAIAKSAAAVVNMKALRRCVSTVAGLSDPQRTRRALWSLLPGVEFGPHDSARDAPMSTRVFNSSFTSPRKSRRAEQSPHVFHAAIDSGCRWNDSHHHSSVLSRRCYRCLHFCEDLIDSIDAILDRAGVEQPQNDSGGLDLLVRHQTLGGLPSLV